MDFIFMLTRNDHTVTDCVGAMERIEPLGLEHIGFKDVGVDVDTLEELHRQIKRTGATSYLEIVSTTRERALQSARIAVNLGVDCLLGGVWIEDTLNILAGSHTQYFPFAGRPEGHPTRLAGTPDLVAEECRRFGAAGCAGVDLLAYRATEADPSALIQAARPCVSGRLIVAGSITHAAQLRELAAAGVDAFTVGSAIFAGEIAPDAALLESQILALLDMLDAVVRSS
jgi:hypothetical protein